MTDINVNVTGSVITEQDLGGYLKPGYILKTLDTEEAWANHGRNIARRISSAAWEIGDWLLHAEAKWGERYKQAARITGLAEGSLRQYAWVARTFELSRRLDDLSFGHHHLVAAIPPEAAQQWLDLAASEHWTVRELQAALRSVRQLPPGNPDVIVTTYKITIPQDHDERWRKAAEARGLDIQDWLIAVADEAAA